jgi:hypothetical protein
MLARLTQLSRRILLRARTLLPKKRLGVVGSFLVFAVVILGVFGVVDVIFAEVEMITWVMNGVISALSWAMFIIARLCIGLTIFFLKFFVEVAKYNNYIDTPTVKVGWFLVRDVANMFFVVLLLVISFGTILGVEQYEWKKTLGKLVFAAIFINFSNTIAQLIIDVAQVFTITFVNAISATAGGNIITMFNIDTVYKITGAEELGIGGNIRLETFGASVAVFLMALLMAVTIGAYALVMVARMVVLWVLIIVSPLAYIFQVIPQTQKYAQEWWSQFINHVIVAPVMVFFVWLAFATLSAPQQYLNLNADTFEEANSALEGQTYKLSISEATSWQNLANYIIAIAFLLVGLRKVRELGVEAGGLTSSATGFAKKVAGYATGYVVGRAAYEGIAGMSKKVGEGALRVAGEAGKIVTTKRRRYLTRNGKYNPVRLLHESNVRRQAALKRIDETDAQHDKELASRGPGKFWERFAGSKAGLANQTVRTALAEKASQTEMDTLQNNAFVELARDEKGDFLSSKMDMLGKEFGNEIKKLKLDGVASEFRKAIQSANQEGVSTEDRDKALATAEDHLKTIEGALGSGKYKAVGQKEENLREKDGDKLLDYTRRRNLDRELGKQTLFYRSTLARIDEEETKGDKEAVEKGTYGGFSLGYLTEERNLLEKRIADADKELLKEKEDALVAALEDGTEEEQGEARASLRREKARVIQSARDNNLQRLRSIALSEAQESFGGEGWAALSEEERTEAVAAKLKDGTFIATHGDHAKIKTKYADANILDSNATGPYAQALDEFLDEGVKEVRIGEFRDGMIANLRSEIASELTSQDADFVNLSASEQEQVISEKLQKNVTYKELQVKVDSNNLDEELLRKQIGDQLKETKKEEWNKAKVSERMNMIASAYSAMSDTEKQNVRASSSQTDRSDLLRVAALASISDQDRGLAYAKYGGHGVTSGLSKLAGEYLTKQNERQDKKYTSETERVGAIIGDQVRMEEGKRPELKRNWEFKRGMEDLKEYEDLSLNELLGELQQNHSQIKKLAVRAKAGDLKAPEEKDAYKNYSQRQMRAVASLVSRFPGSAPGVLGSLDSSYKNVLLSDPGQIHTMMAGLLSGRSYQDVSGNFASVQEDVRKALKEKADPLFHALMLGVQKAADSGFSQYYDQLRVGYDANGATKIGFTNSFKSGLGAEKGSMGTGNASYDGKSFRDSEMRSNAFPGVNINSAKDGRAYVVVDGNGKAQKVLSEEHRRAIRQIASLSRTAIQAMDPTKLWTMLGGSWSKSAWDGKKFDVTEDMGQVLGEVMGDFAKNINSSKSASTRDNILSSWKEVLKQLNIDKVDGVDLAAATAEQLAEFINKQESIKADIKIVRIKPDNDDGEEGDTAKSPSTPSPVTPPTSSTTSKPEDFIT